ncbi:KDEL motif-containing protein 1 [Cryptotermes secundus]|uniref:KDEL motif-containing protein 1 n=1 Tax=Cryptotermes secundus TaxID=105785 RepID=A0A2J7RL43_9NEOP|nr:protein O-glucosyltransferase 2 [Cryptotermes secundus]XP_033610489.1 protein O-glucosyltransferase 2 [Cryptotermes secundus]PNF41553.1 KDEL motif-containing protein 1 [Cryptotermes secundus]
MVLLLLLLALILDGVFLVRSKGLVDPAECQIWGPGLQPDKIVMPARYFYIVAVDKHKLKLKESPEDVFEVQITGDSSYNNCRVWINTLNRNDGSFIVRYKTYHTCHNFTIHVTYKGVHVASSPYIIKGPVYADGCYCPVKSMSDWLKQFGCKSSYDQISSDLKPFPNVKFTEIRALALQRFSHPGSMSICNYVIKDNQVYRKCYGQYVGFKMFLDAILLSLARKVYLPDMEMLFNLGDWPLVHTGQKPYIPMFSWCGSNDTLDIVMPTYDITEATLECMGRVMLDMLSVQGHIEKKWEEKIEKAFWRGRDSRRERLKLIDIAREHPELFNVTLTNFFFFRDEEKYYGPKAEHISFFKFFDYKYQINIDGTVAAYRFPYLLAGDSLVFKQNSKYYEYFYKELEPWKHYVPFRSDLSDLVERIRWAKDNDAEAQTIARTGQKFAQENLMPQDVFCYHAVLFKEWSDQLRENVEVRDDMEHVPQPGPDKPYTDCNCHRSDKSAKAVHLNTREEDMNTRDEL